ncbi:hypothetical protein [Streptomyces sp. NBC_01766]|uniref:hypothetical protein n=1 Tax=Streptomyces sp. NBC_01766 TaxID=2975936 RepID=UPI002DD94219|nr:hypothetical protein [Streptomyces sp. NBC_01766]WSC24447.1 hypothetical protein OIE60_34955 [Streptomyces sp. NBC_01766]
MREAAGTAGGHPDAHTTAEYEDPAIQSDFPAFVRTLAASPDSTRGFGLLSGDLDQYITSPDATVTTEDNALVEVEWRGRLRKVFFQDGPYFTPAPGTDTTVLARYTNGLAAALVTSYGAGRVAVVGPHPEATAD